MRYYIPGIPEPEAQALAESLTPTDGTIEFTNTYPGLLDDYPREGILFEVVKRSTVWQLIRDASHKLHFVHATPSSGTRVATVDLRALREVTPCDVFFLGLVWAPQELRLSIGRLDQRGILHTAHGAKAPFTVQVAADDKVIYLGDHGLEVMGARIYATGKTVLRPSAWDTWQEIRRAVDTLLTGSSPEGYLFEVVVVNTVLAFLVTGFEAYCQTRFYEMESEGWTLDLRAIVRTFLTREEQDRFERGDELDIQRYATAAGWSFTRALVENRRINFQRYASAKRAFNKAYGVKFGALQGVSSAHLHDLQRFIQYRHRIVHVSPLNALLNASYVPQEPPLFSNRETARRAIETFNVFVTALHDKTVSPAGATT